MESIAVLTPKLESMGNSNILTKEPNEVYLTLFRDMASLEKGSRSQLARLYNYLDSIVGIAKRTASSRWVPLPKALTFR